MRITLKFKVRKPLTLPKSYQRFVQGFIYEQIKGTAFSNFLHNEGFGEERKFKLFTFSLLKGPYSYNQKNHTVTFDDYFYLEIASVVEAFIHQLTEALLDADSLTLNETPIELQKYHYQAKQIKCDTLTIEMVSPITVYKTINENGKNKTHYFDPKDKDFALYVNQNFQRKFQSVYTVEKTPYITITPIEVNPEDKLVLKYKNQVIIAYKGVYHLKGNPDFLDFLYRTGLGSKNSMGFGMFKVRE